jgi:hypothetical protein
MLQRQKRTGNEDDRYPVAPVRVDREHEHQGQRDPEAKKQPQPHARIGGRGRARQYGRQTKMLHGQASGRDTCHRERKHPRSAPLRKPGRRHDGPEEHDDSDARSGPHRFRRGCYNECRGHDDESRQQGQDEEEAERGEEPAAGRDAPPSAGRERRKASHRDACDRGDAPGFVGSHEAQEARQEKGRSQDQNMTPWQKVGGAAARVDGLLCGSRPAVHSDRSLLRWAMTVSAIAVTAATKIPRPMITYATVTSLPRVVTGARSP